MGGQVGGGKGRGGTWQKLLPLWAEQGRPRPVQPHLLQVQEKKHRGGSSQKLLGALRVTEPPRPPQNSHGGGLRVPVVVGGTWKGGTAPPNASAPGLVPKASKLGKAERGGAGPGEGAGVTQSCSPDPQKPSWSPPSSPGKAAKAGPGAGLAKGSPPKSARRSVLAFGGAWGGWWAAGRGWGGTARSGGVGGISPLGTPRSGLVSPVAVSPCPHGGAGGALPCCFGGVVSLVLVPRTCHGRAKILTEGSSRCAAQGDCAPSSSPTIVSSRISPAGTPSPSGGRGSRGAARSEGRRCQARPACRPGGVGEGTWGCGQEGMESVGPPQPLPYLIPVRLQEHHLGLGERRHGDGLDTVRGVQSPPGEKFGGSAPPPAPINTQNGALSLKKEAAKKPRT